MQKKKLKATLTLREVSVEDLCSDIGMSRSAWYRKVSGGSEFTREEIAQIAMRLNLSEKEVVDIFFDEIVTCAKQ